MKWRRFFVVLLVGLFGVGTLLYLLAEFHEEIAEPFLMFLDLHVQSVVHGYTSPGVTRVMLDLTWIGSPGFLFPSAVLIVAFLWWRRLTRDAGIFATAMIGAVILIGALKLYFHRARPDVSWALAEEHSFSFPSGHSIVAVVLYGSLVYLGFPRWRQMWQRVVGSVVAVGMVAGIGLSRIYLGVHYPSDVAAGYLVGCAWLTTVMVAEWGVQAMDRRHDLAIAGRQSGKDAFD